MGLALATKDREVSALRLKEITDYHRTFLFREFYKTAVEGISLATNDHEISALRLKEITDSHALI